jgi:hypothetical protein
LDLLNEAMLFGTDNPNEFGKRAVMLRLIYTDPRYAPAGDKRAILRAIETALTRNGIEVPPVRHHRKVAVYCGNYYLLPSDTLGTLAQCGGKYGPS